MKTRILCLCLSLTTIAIGCSSGRTQHVRKVRVHSALGTTIPPQQRTYPARLSEHDFMTDLDTLYARPINRALQGGPISDWPLIKQLRRVSVDLADAATHGMHMNVSFLAQGQSEFADIRKQVDECAEILGLDVPPRLFVKQDSNLNAYVTGVGEPHVLVLTSGLIEKLQDRPDELRFIIGHELGHLKCGHLRAHTVGRIVVQQLSGGQAGSLRREVVTPLLLWKLMWWYRASEMSADRAGLICVGRVPDDPDYARRTAEQALVRLLHGTGSVVDVDTYLREVQRLELNEPFLKIARRIQVLGVSHPFVPERCLALRQWERGDQFQTLLNRPQTRGATRWVTIHAINIKGLPHTDAGTGLHARCDPLVALTYGGRERTCRVCENTSSPAFRDLNWRFAWTENARITIHVEDYDSLSPNDSVGSTILTVPIDGDSTEAPLWLDEKRSTRPDVRVRFSVE